MFDHRFYGNRSGCNYFDFTHWCFNCCFKCLELGVMAVAILGFFVPQGTIFGRQDEAWGGVRGGADCGSNLLITR